GVLGRILFGNEGYFPAGEKFTLAPLMDDGPASLHCDDIEGIETIRLIEYRRFWGGQHKESEVRRTADVFAALAARGLEFPLGPPPSSAIFIVKFTDAPKERRVVIRVPSSARYDRDQDSEIFERWLAARGFLKQAQTEDAHDPEALAQVLGGARVSAGVDDGQARVATPSR
ncbi:hypothetical protein WDZ92_44585, partial [Nostoc sp. NIES-2111]